MKKLFIFLLSFTLLSFVPVTNESLPLPSDSDGIEDTTITPVRDSIIYLDTTKSDTLLAIKTSSEKEVNSNEVEKDAGTGYSGTGDFYKGLASFYASKFNGRKTATGEIFSNSGMTAASNLFRLGTWVKVTNTRNGKTVIVKVNDRMAPSMHKKGRILDLTQAAARKLEFYNSGIANVKVEIIKKDTAAR